MNAPDNIMKILALVYLLAIVVELFWSKRKKKQVYNWKDSLANIGIVIGGRLIKPLSVAWAYFIYTHIMPYQFLAIETNALTLCIAFFLVEFIYYWHHRLNHEIPFLWAIHHTHHSSQWFNFVTASRLNWLGKFIGPFFYLPLILAGFSPALVVSMLALSLVYQIFIHTEMIGKLGWLEGILNTPSAHRVHHASNEDYLDKNYGGILMLYDRLFGTYRPEQEATEYGVTTGFVGHNPLIINFQPMIQLFRKQIKTRKEKMALPTATHVDNESVPFQS
ncbi:MAG TPA: sterol desaturase family protein [Microscillaceae bacterium]|nr:sterol desaturase family protein [Microscillaceae bacterium]